MAKPTRPKQGSQKRTPASKQSRRPRRRKAPATDSTTATKSIRSLERPTSPGLRGTPLAPRTVEPKAEVGTEASLESPPSEPDTAPPRAARRTVPGGVAPPLDDVTRARQALRELREIVENASDADAEVILGDGSLEGLLASVIPPIKPGTSIHEHLAAHKRRASLLARIRHGINASSAFADGERFVSPTRAQWFYDGLTFLEGDAPYDGVVGLYREGVLRYGVGVPDVAKGESLGPLAVDFVSAADARKSLRSATEPARLGLDRFASLYAQREDDPTRWTDLLRDHPWMLGCQHLSILETESNDPELPRLTARRALDGAQDVLLVEPPSTRLVGSNGRALSGFRDVWLQAERLRTFVQRQADYLKRELGWKIRDPRFLVLAGRDVDPRERAIVHEEFESHHAAVRLVTYDELRALAARSFEVFETRARSAD